MTLTLGAFGESWAAGYLSRQGYRIVARNVRFRVGEIDIVAQDGDSLVFVEVKCRRSRRYGAPEESVTARRFGRLARAIDEYLSRNGFAPESYRIDIVAIEVDRAGVVSRCALLQGVEAPQ